MTPLSMELVCDGFGGVWYWEKSDGRRSQNFNTQQAAREAKASGKLIWSQETEKE